MSIELLDHVVAGALFDFAAFLTTRENAVSIGASKNSAPMAELLVKFLTLRGVDQECEPMVVDWPTRCSGLPLPKPSPCKEALKVLSDAMKADPMYAWSWHCNIAMAAVDAGASHSVGNAAAERFMYAAFGVDTSETRSVV